MNHATLAELLFPSITTAPETYEAQFPPRQLPQGAKVTRLGPSPTGFIHLGNLYGAFADERLAHQSGGLFYLRIEDTDEKRQVEGAVEAIIASLHYFGLNFDEGAAAHGEKGSYGPYYQSSRGAIYQCYAKSLIQKGLAYPCFLSEEEVAEIRASQEANKENPGIYGKYAAHRNLSLEEIQERVARGDQFVIRLRSGGSPGGPGDAPVKTITIEDGIRGTLEMPENFLDSVILKANGIPTYHFAHVVDDHLMRTTHVVRGEEWLSTLPIHVELFTVLGFPLPIYCHTAQIMKLDEGNKRKLSKRKDPEASLEYYRREGYHPEAVREYLMTLLNSNYEEWRIANPTSPLESFAFSTDKMSNAGALFDLSKLNDVSKDTLARMTAGALADFMLEWAARYAPEVEPVLSRDKALLEQILSIGRGGDKPRKDLVHASQMFQFIKFFYDEYFVQEDPYPANADGEMAKTLLAEYLADYDHSDDQEAWFNKVRQLGERHNYAAKPKDYKKNPEQYRGHVGDVSTVIRIALTGRANAPDLWEIQQILGEAQTKVRLSRG